MSVVFEGLAVGGFPPVEFRTLPHHLADAEHPGTVRVLRGFTFRVMLAVHGDPLARHHAGGQPQPEAEEVADHGMQVERAVRLVAVQVDSDAGDGHMGQHQPREDHADP